MTMTTTPVPTVGAALAATAVLLLTAGCDRREPSPVQRGEYLVTTHACADCHTPWHMGPNGPEPDPSRHLSGHPEALAITAPPQTESPWGSQGSLTNTAWAGPWGVSFTTNLTPDPETGLGRWTEDMFVQAIRSGRHLGSGRPILPPMPWTAYRQLTDGDLKAMFAYLRSLPPIRNRVPDPLPRS